LDLFREGLGKYWRITADEKLAAGIKLDPPAEPPERFPNEELLSQGSSHSEYNTPADGEPPNGINQEALAPSEPSKAGNGPNGSVPCEGGGSMEAPRENKSSEGPDNLEGIPVGGGEPESQEILAKAL